MVKDVKVLNLEAELEAADADLDIYHHYNVPNGVLLHRSVFHNPNRNPKRTISVSPFR